MDHLRKINVGAKNESKSRVHFNISDGKAAEIIKFISLIKSTFTWDPKWIQTGLKSQTALKSRSVYMEISLRQRANESFLINQCY